MYWIDYNVVATIQSHKNTCKEDNFFIFCITPWLYINYSLFCNIKKVLDINRKAHHFLKQHCQYVNICTHANVVV